MTPRLRLTNYNVAAANVAFAVLFGALLGVFCTLGLAALLPPTAALIVGATLPIAGCFAIASRTPTSIELGDRVVVRRVLGRVEFPVEELDEVEIDQRTERAAGRGYSTPIGRYLVAVFRARVAGRLRSFTVKVDRDEVGALEQQLGADRITLSRALTSPR